MVDAGVLTGLLHLGSDRRLARLASFACALVATWLINRSTTFADRAGALSLAEFIRYAGASSGAAVVNLGVYLALTSGCDVFRREPVIAIAAATGLSMSLNFWSYLRLVFAR
ncbi:putative flippase GtrA [Labrys monachus]|uniref:Flippase GtrA n=2 Tax=Labrys monachus TaxID=217067 RepID=A0ABU0FD88_9HYPH|nr:putative flippase GtrA [Labrys monachus]